MSTDTRPSQAPDDGDPDGNTQVRPLASSVHPESIPEFNINTSGSSDPHSAAQSVATVLASGPSIQHWPLPATKYSADPTPADTLSALLRAYPQLRFPIATGTNQTLDYLRAISPHTAPPLVPPRPGIALRQPQQLTAHLHHSPGGWLPVIETGDRDDWWQLVCALRFRNEPATISPWTRSLLIGGLFNAARFRALTAAARKSNTQPTPTVDSCRESVVVLAPGPYSGVDARHLQLPDSQWPEISRRLRLEHEGCHYLVRRLFPGRPFGLVDELLADFFALVEVTQRFRARDFLLFMGLLDDSDDTAPTDRGRLAAYDMLPELQLDQRQHSIQQLIAAARLLESWSSTWSRQQWHGARISFIQGLTRLGLDGIANCRDPGQLESAHAHALTLTEPAGGSTQPPATPAES